MNTAEIGRSLHSDVPPDWYFSSLKTNVLQQFWHKRRFTLIRSLAETQPGCSILDVGCADGVFSDVIARHTGAKELIGVDILEASVAWANEHWGKKAMRFMVADAHELPFSDNEFDAVFALEMMEHIPRPDKVLSEIHRVLKSGGYAIVLVPIENILFKCIWFIWTKSKGRIWKEAHIQEYDEKSLIDLSHDAKLQVSKTQYALFGMLLAVKLRKP